MEMIDIPTDYTESDKYRLLWFEFHAHTNLPRTAYDTIILPGVARLGEAKGFKWARDVIRAWSVK